MATHTAKEWEERFTADTTSLPEPPLPLEIRKCWTILEVDGVRYIIPGIHTINRVGYVTTREEWTDADLLHEWFW